MYVDAGMDPKPAKERPKRSAALPARLSCAGESGAAAGLGLTRAPDREGSVTSPPPSPTPSSLQWSPGDPAELARIRQTIRDKDPEMKALLAKLKVARELPAGCGRDEEGSEYGEVWDVPGTPRGTPKVASTTGKDDSPSERAAKLPERSARSDPDDASVSGESMGEGTACDDAQDDNSSDSSSDVDTQSASTAGGSRRAGIVITAASKAKGKRVGEERGGRDEGNEPQSAGKRRRKKPLPPEQPAPKGVYGTWKLTLLRRIVLFRGLSGHQKQKDKGVLSNLLTRQDAEKSRATPYTGDFVVKRTSSSPGEFPALHVAPRCPRMASYDIPDTLGCV